MHLFDSAFSPFARKVRMVLEFKGLEFEVKEGLLKSNHADLKAVNGRVEVPGGWLAGRCLSGWLAARGHCRPIAAVCF